MQLGGELKIDYSKYENYFEESKEYKNLEEEINSVTSKSIENTYKEEIEKQIKKDLENIGFFIEDISLEINLETGEITNLILYLEDEKKESSNNTIVIEKVEIGETKDKTQKNDLSEKKLKKIKELLKENYNIDSEMISINSI